MDTAPDFIIEQQPTSDDKLTVVRAKAEEARDLELSIQSLEERLKLMKSTLSKIYFEELPDLMDNAGVDRIGLPARGNLPAVDAILSPYYRANIAASWSQERREAAFSALANLGHEDLIKATITLRLARTEHELLEEIVSLLKAEFDFEPEVNETIHPQTLTAFVKEQFERHKPLPPLDVIGASIGRVVKLKERGEDHGS